MKNKSAYHWLVAFTGFVCIFMASGVCNTSFSTVSVYLFDFWGISNTVYGTMVSVRTFASVAGIAFVAVYYRNLSYRWGLALSMLFGAVGWVFFWSGVEFILSFFRLFLPDYMIDTIASFSFLTHFGSIDQRTPSHLEERNDRFPPRMVRCGRLQTAPQRGGRQRNLPAGRSAPAGGCAAVDSDESQCAFH